MGSLLTVRLKLDALIDHSQESGGPEMHTFYEAFMASNYVQVIIEQHMSSIADIVEAVLAMRVNEGFVVIT